MLESKKHVFWQALLLTVLFFILGLVFGVYLEQLRSENFNTAFYQSEISLYDSLAVTKLSEGGFVSCNDLKEANLEFADKIYTEARDLERFDEKSQLTESLRTIHRKYDLLRTILWMNTIDVNKKCGDLSTIVYLYTYDAEDVNIKSEQAVWSRILGDLKEKKGNKVILIPIAADNNLTSLDFMAKKFGVQRYPAVIINEKHILYDLESVATIEKYLE
ncbi:MAG: hypothetical protein AABX91_02820 [Nanoarchaeota archaeon]